MPIFETPALSTTDVSNIEDLRLTVASLRHQVTCQRWRSAAGFSLARHLKNQLYCAAQFTSKAGSTHQLGTHCVKCASPLSTAVDSELNSLRRELALERQQRRHTENCALAEIARLHRLVAGESGDHAADMAVWEKTNGKLQALWQDLKHLTLVTSYLSEHYAGMDTLLAKLASQFDNIRHQQATNDQLIEEIKSRLASCTEYRTMVVGRLAELETRLTWATPSTPKLTQVPDQVRQLNVQMRSLLVHLSSMDLRLLTIDEWHQKINGSIDSAYIDDRDGKRPSSPRDQIAKTFTMNTVENSCPETPTLPFIDFANTERSETKQSHCEEVTFQLTRTRIKRFSSSQLKRCHVPRFCRFRRSMKLEVCAPLVTPSPVDANQVLLVTVDEHQPLYFAETTSRVGIYANISEASLNWVSVQRHQLPVVESHSNVCFLATRSTVPTTNPLLTCYSSNGYLQTANCRVDLYANNQASPSIGIQLPPTGNSTWLKISQSFRSWSTRK